MNPKIKNNLFVIVFLGLGLATILLVSLWWRFSNPSLTIHRFADSGVTMPPVMDSKMDGIGRLMAQAAQNPHDVPILLKLAESLMAIGQWESAENFVQKALTEPGENSRATYLLAVIHHNRGHHAEAAELLEKLLARQENPSARYSLGILYIHYLNQPEKGRVQLERGLAAEGVPESLVQAMQEELGKLPPVPEHPSSGEEENG